METQGTERSFAWYLGGLGTWFGSLGLQMVLFPFLATIVLEESAFRVGLAQTALMAPSILFMIFGGAFAERRDTRSLLIRIHMLASVPPFLMAAILVAGELSFGWIILYGLAMGTMSAFAIPARDSLLSHVAEKSFGPDIQRAVVLASGIQFVGQLAGIILAGTENLVGAPALLIFQALVMLGGAVMVRKLAAAPPMDRPPAHPLEDMRDGIPHGVRLSHPHASGARHVCGRGALRRRVHGAAAADGA